MQSSPYMFIITNKFHFEMELVSQESRVSSLLESNLNLSWNPKAAFLWDWELHLFQQFQDVSTKA